jgi:ABC-2 type transport system permease protein
MLTRPDGNKVFSMRLFFSFIRHSYISMTTYLFDFWMQVIGSFILMYGAHWLWNTLYSHRPDLFSTSREQMLAYAMMAIVVNFFLNQSNFVRFYITGQIRSGDIQMDLLRPLDFPYFIITRSAGMTLFNVMVPCLPAFFLGVLFLGLKGPSSLLSGLLFLLSLLLAFLVAVALQFLIGLMAVYTIEARRIVWFYMAVLRFFSGQMIPLWIFPSLLAQIATLLPFQALVNIPLSIYIGRLDEAQTAQALGLQAAWAAGLLLLGRLIWGRAYRRLTVQGG